MHKGSLFVVIEGLDGSGKTSASKVLVEMLNAQNPESVLLSYEPHNPSCAGTFIRQILTKEITQFDPHFLPLAFATNRLDHCHRVIKPWLAAGDNHIVICDRYYLSSLVYQSDDHYSFDDIMKLNEFAKKPDIIFFFNVDNKTCYERMHIRNQSPELFETNLSETREKYFKAIEYLRETRDENIVEIDGSGTIEEVANKLRDEIYAFAPQLNMITGNFGNLIKT
jgi:dTMP kinase